MNALDRWIHRFARKRGWAVGPAAVQRADMMFGLGEESWSPADYGGYMRTSNGVYSCVRMRSQMLAQLPLKAYDRDTDGELEEVESGPVLDLLRGVNDHWTLNRLLWMTEASLSLWGESYWYVERGEGGGMPTELWWMRPDRMKVVPHEVDYVRGFIYEDGSQRIPFEADEVIWLRYPNPTNEFRGLSPLESARLAADVGTAAMGSNYSIFSQGNIPAGVMMPAQDSGLGYTDAQMADLGRYFERRLGGVDKKHRIAILKQRADFQQLSWSPQDAEFLGSLGASLEDVARAYGVPLFLLGVRDGATFNNVGEARKAIWSQTLIPEAEFIGAELTEQLLPMFGAAAPDVLAFDWSSLPELQEDEAARWTRAREQITAGALTINEWRIDQGLEPVDWGDVAWLPAGMTPVDDGVVEMPAPSAPPAPEPVEEPEPDDELEPDDGERRQRDMAYNSPEHRALMARFEQRVESLEEQTEREVAKLFERQMNSILAQIDNERSARADDEDGPPSGLTLAALAAIFQRARWVREWRIAARRWGWRTILSAGKDIGEDLGEPVPDLKSVAGIVRFLEARAQRTGADIVDVTWQKMRKSVAEGIAAGESRKTISQRVQDVMGPMAAGRARTIARTETIGYYNGSGALAAAEMGARSKTWSTSQDSKVRPAKPSDRGNHRDMHDVTVAIDEDFRLPSGARGSGPGNTGVAYEDINCRCVLTYSVEPPPRIAAGAHYHEVTHDH